MTEISQEDKAIIKYAADSGVPYAVTCTIQHSTSTASGNLSRHVMQGTGGLGLAVDLAGPHGGSDTPELMNIFKVFDEIGPQLYELIYSGADHGWKNGKRVPQSFWGSTVLQIHHNHVHIAVNKGVFLQHASPSPNPIPPQEDDMPTVVAQDFVMNPNKPTQGYLLDAQGGIHSIGGAPNAVGGAYWPLDKGIGPARKIQVTDWSKPAGYVLDALGGVHPFGGAPAVTGGAYWSGGFIPPSVHV